MAFIAPKKQRYKHLLFDLDGTLIQSGKFRIQIAFIIRLLAMLHHHRGWIAAWKALSASQKSLLLPSPEKTNQVRMIEAFDQHLGLGTAETQKQVDQSIKLVFQTLKPFFGKIPGAAAFVEWAHQRHSLTLATNPVWPIEMVHMRMHWGGIHPFYFKSITTADRMHYCKPWPEYYKEILTQEKIKPGDCLHIGNEIKMDLPATRAGIAVFIVDAKVTELTVLEKPGTVINKVISPGAWTGTFKHLKDFLNS